jgi:integrase
MEETTIKVKGLISYFKLNIIRRNERRLNCFNYDVAIMHLINYAAEPEVHFNKLSREWFEGLKAYLLQARGIRSDKQLSINSANTYFTIIRAVAKEAADERLIDHGVVKNLSNVQTRMKAETSALSMHELERLTHTNCRVLDLKKAFLFSCLTGLGWSFVSSLTWGQIIVDVNDDWEIVLKHNVDKRVPLSKQARELLGVGGHKTKKVFNLHYTAALCVNLNKWALAAGITRNITFQSARQTFGKMLLDQGVALELISELLGHKHLKTTVKFLGVEKTTVPLTTDYLRGFTI